MRALGEVLCVLYITQQPMGKEEGRKINRKISRTLARFLICLTLLVCHPASQEASRVKSNLAQTPTLATGSLVGFFIKLPLEFIPTLFCTS